MIKKVVIADDSNIILVGMKGLLDDEPDIEVVGVALGGVAAVQLTEKLDPDVLVTDMIMEDMNGLEVTRRIVKPELPVLVLSMYDNSEYVRSSVEAGARGYILKDSAAEELAHAIRAVAKGKMYFSHNLSRKLVEGLMAEFGAN